jgi:hypothetical protein
MSDEKTYSAYPSLYSLGHRAIQDIFLDPVTVEEKIDGSQFSFGVTRGHLQCRSKRTVLDNEAPEKLFAGAVGTAVSLFNAGLLVEGDVYRGEAIQTPKHNTLAYSRVPKGNVILFDIMRGPENYLDHNAKRLEAERLGLEVVPMIFHGSVLSAEDIKAFLERESILGGQKIEGVVIKNYVRFGYDKKQLFAKFVSEAFKEIHQGDWKDRSPGPQDILTKLVERYKTPARWEKAVFHLRDDGKLTNTPQDIGPLMKEVQTDILKECKEEIERILFKWAWENLSRRLCGGLPQWYKDRLLATQNYPTQEAT